MLAIWPDLGPVLRREGADPAQDARQPALLAEHIELEGLELGDVPARGDGGEGLVAQRLEVAGQVGEIHIRPSIGLSITNV